jgi:prepilin-type N-terminal cleavage/methylation domain-containing protein
MVSIRRRKAQAGFTLIELLIVMAIILVIAAIAVPQMGKQIMSAHETATITEIGTIHSAEVSYLSQFGQYATSLTQLGPPASGAEGPAAAGLLSKGGLSEGHASGYIFTVTGTPTGYAISAVPEQFGSSGSRTFYSDQTLVIRNNYTQEPATANSPAIGAAIAPAATAPAPTTAPPARRPTTLNRRSRPSRPIPRTTGPPSFAER